MDDADREQRFDALYHAHYRAILAYCLRRAGRDDAFDATAETFAIAWRRFDDVPGDEKAIRWLYGVSSRVLANQRRSSFRLARVRRKVAGLGQHAETGPDVPVVRRDEDDAVLVALGRLSSRDQELLRLYAWEDLTREQIATHLGITLAAVHQRIHRAYARLAKQLRGTTHDRTTTAPRSVEEGGRR